MDSSLYMLRMTNNFLYYFIVMQLNQIPWELRYLKTKLCLPDNKILRYVKKYLEDPQWTLQEYPTVPEDAFISSWRSFFDLTVLKQYSPVVGEQDSTYSELIRYDKTPNYDSIIGIDIAEGLSRWDYSVIRVRSRTWKLIASFRSNSIEPGDLTKIVDHIYWHNIQWIIGPERNNHGHTFLFAAKDYRRYNDIYQYQQKDRSNPTQVVNKLWWSTDLVTRPMMLDELKIMVRDQIIELDDLFINEAFNFLVINKKPQAQQGFNDDVIMADAICLQMLKENKLDARWMMK